MTFPTTNIPTANLDSAADDPSLARADLLQTVQTLNTIIDEAGQAFGVALLTSEGKISQSQIPSSIITGTDENLTLAPDSAVVRINYILRIGGYPKSVLVQITGGEAGDIAVCDDIEAQPVICIFNGTVWKYLPTASLTTVTA